MARKSVYDEPGYRNPQDDPANLGYGGQAAGDPSDPRGGYDPQTSPLGDSSDPRGDSPKKSSRAKDALGSPLKNAAGRGLRKPKHKEDEGIKKGLRDSENQPGLYNPEGEGGTEASPSDLKDEEDSGGFFKNYKDSKKDKARDFLKRNKKKAAIGGGILFGVTGGLIGIMTFLLPLKVEHIVNNLESHFFGTSQEAIQKEADEFLKEYMISRVLPGYQSCGSTIKKGCHAHDFGKGPVANLYRSWADARLENKLAKKGIYMEYRKVSQKWTLYGPGISKDGEDLGKNGEKFATVYDNHEDFRNDSRQLVKQETRWNQVLFRFQVDRGLTGGKFSTSRYCVVFCFLTDPLSKEIDKQRLASKIFLTNRVILPRNESLGIALSCLINDCTPDNNQPSDENINGSPESDYDKETKAALGKYAATSLDRPLAGAALDEVFDTYKNIAEIGFQKYLVTKALTPIIGQAAAGGASDAIPIAGWINLAAQVVNFSNDSSGSVKKFRYVANGAVAAVSLYAMYRSGADEAHTGHMTATEAGSFAQSLSPGDHGEPTDPIKGGTAGAEQVPLYANIIEGKSVAQATAATAKPSDVSVSGLLQGKAYAASPAVAGSSNYLCGNGLPLPAGQLICPEEFLGGGNSIANGIHGVINTPPLSALIPIAQAWDATVGQVFDFAGGIAGSAFNAVVAPLNAVCDTPVIGNFAGNGYCAARSAAQKALPAIVDAVTVWLIPNPFSTNMSGGRTFDMMAAGADVLGNETAHTVLGGQLLTPAQRANIAGEQQKSEQNAFSRRPLFARMFDTDSQHSLVSKVAMEVPLGGTQVAAQSGMATLLNPVSALSHGFSSIFSGKANADPEVAPDPFGVPQYGYPEGTIPENPEAYWEANCSDDASHAYQKGSNSWNESASGVGNADPDTGTPLNKTTNPCLLIKATIGAVGGLYDTDNLTEADLTGVSSGETGVDPTSVAGGTIDMDHLYDSSVDVGCAPHTKDLGIADGYHDNKKVKIRICAVSNVDSSSSESNGQYGVTGANGKLVVNSRISQVIYDMVEAAKKDGVNLKPPDDPDSGFRTMAHQECLYAHTCGDNPAATPGTSNHQMGVAIDWGEPMYTWLANGNGARFGFKALVGGEPWHWSPTGN